MKRNCIVALVGRALCVVAGVALVLVACTADDNSTGLASSLLEGSDIVIAAIDPDTATVDTAVTVRITGSGFTDGATVTWLVDTTESREIRTLSTTWKSPSEIEARIAISSNAPLRSYSVRIRGKKGKQGIAVEKFRVVAKPIPLPQPGNASEASDINDSGVIVGYANDAGTTVAVRWTPVDTGWVYTILGTGNAIAINNDGLIVRVHFDPLARAYHSWIHYPSGTVSDRGFVYVSDVSDNGTLIGWIGDVAGKATAVVWKKQTAESWGEPEPLPVPAEFSGASALDINAADDVLGSIFTSGTSFGVVWRYRDGQWQSPALVDANMNSGARAINDNGALVGSFLPCIPGLPNCYATPTWWLSLGAPRIILPTLYNSPASAAGINNANQIVGSALVHYSDGVTVLAPLVRHAVIWFPGSQWPEDLGAIRPSHYGSAVAINNHGWVAGTMSNLEPFDRHATVWKLPATPIAGTPSAAHR